jgi:4-hydroxybenzoate polyprenyltransferase
MVSLKPYLQLARPANLVTAVADILAGMAIAGMAVEVSPALWLIVSTLGLYGGGVVLNDVFDAKLDSVERPERPIPSGKVPLANAATLGVSLLLIGVLSAFFFQLESGVIALCIALATVVYNRLAKHHRFFGPLVMGFCRGGNLLLGISAVFPSLTEWWLLAGIPVLYIAAITLISQDEVHGGKRFSLYVAGALYILVHLAQAGVAWQQGTFSYAVLFIVLHAWLIGRPLRRAIASPVGPLIGKAVKAGVLSLIVMNAAWCVVFGYLVLGLFVAALLPVSIFLGKRFAVT